MKESVVGEILYKLRMEKGASQEALCYGLCSVSNLSKYETGERLPDRLILNALLQRLGKSAGRMETLLSNEEYQYFYDRKELLTAVAEQDKEAFNSMLVQMYGSEALPGKRKYLINETLEKQFQYRMLAIRAEWIWGDVKTGIALLHQGIVLTMPKVQQGRSAHVLISMEEMLMLLELAQLYLLDKRETEAEELLRRLLVYIEIHFEDIEIKTQIYPKLVKIYIPLLIKKQKYAECMTLCNKAIALLQDAGILFDLVELLEGYLYCASAPVFTEKEKQYGKLAEALRALYLEAGVEYRTGSLYRFYSTREIYLINEVIRYTRRSRMISQESLSDGICTPETLSRIESGKRSPNPKNFRRLMERLELEQDYYNLDLDTSDYEVQEKYRKYIRMISLRRWEEARPLLEEVKQEADMKNPHNRSVIEASEKELDFREKKINIEEFQQFCEKALGCENEKWREERFWEQFLTRRKIGLLNNIGCIYSWRGQKMDALFISKKILQKLEKSNVSLQDRFLSGLPLIAGMTTDLGELGMYSECVEMCKKGILLSLNTGKSTLLPMLLSNMAEALELMDTSNRKRCDKYLRQAFYISDFEKSERVNQYIDAFYRERYDEQVIWY